MSCDIFTILSADNKLHICYASHVWIHVLCMVETQEVWRVLDVDMCVRFWMFIYHYSFLPMPTNHSKAWYIALNDTALINVAKKPEVYILKHLSMSYDVLTILSTVNQLHIC